MKSSRFLLILFIVSACIVSAFLTFFQHTKAPVCFNADEAAFGYNAYSLLKTGRDEYGALLPIRLKSFGDYKLPLYSYLSVPFIGLFGLTEQSARGANILIALLFPFAVYLLAKELFNSKRSSVFAAFITASSLGLHIIARQAHEAYLSAFLITLATYYFIRLLKKTTVRRLVPFLIVLFLSLLSYQSGRLFAFFFLFALTLHTFLKKTDKKVFIAAVIAIGIFMLPDVIYTPARVGNLLFFKSPGLGMKTHELRTEGGTIFLYNKGTVAARDFISNHLEYYSPQFLTTRGDLNYRFGFPDMSPVTVIEYMLAFAGMFFLFRTKGKYRHLISGLLLVAPLAGSLSWAGSSLSRTLFLVVLLSIMAGFGFDQLLNTVRGKSKAGMIVVLFSIQVFLLIYGWDIYLNHFPKRALVIRAAQCGYKDLASYIKSRYNDADKIYITPKHGQPYIFQLFYEKADPSKYQKSAMLSAPDKYGFGQVSAFGKYTFDFPKTPPSNAIIVGYPDDFRANPEYSEYSADTQKITVGTEEIFWMLNTANK